MYQQIIMVTAAAAGVAVGLFGIPSSSSPPVEASSIDATIDAKNGAQAGADEALERPLCHGAEAELELEVENRGVGEPLELRVHSHLPEQASMVYGLEMVDDRGRNVIAPTIAQAAKMRVGKMHRESISLPTNIPDGYYALRLTAAAAGPSEETASSAAVFFEQKDGQATRISDEEYYLHSQANAAVSP